MFRSEVQGRGRHQVLGVFCSGILQGVVLPLHAMVVQSVAVGVLKDVSLCPSPPPTSGTGEEGGRDSQTTLRLFERGWVD